MQELAMIRRVKEGLTVHYELIELSLASTTKSISHPIIIRIGEKKMTSREFVHTYLLCMDNVH
jgi:hypothetical protein